MCGVTESVMKSKQLSVENEESIFFKNGQPLTKYANAASVILRWKSFSLKSVSYIEIFWHLYASILLTLTYSLTVWIEAQSNI